MSESITLLIPVDPNLSGTVTIDRKRFDAGEIREDLARKIASAPIWTPMENLLPESGNNEAVETASRLAERIAAVRMPPSD